MGPADVGTSQDLAADRKLRSRILLVEDDASLARVMLDNLRFEGFEARCAVDGAHALAAAVEFRPDLILLDISLPDADGFELCAPLAKRGQSPVIFLTARGQKSDKLRAESRGGRLRDQTVRSGRTVPSSGTCAIGSRSATSRAPCPAMQRPTARR